LGTFLIDDSQITIHFHVHCRIKKRNPTNHVFGEYTAEIIHQILILVFQIVQGLGIGTICTAIEAILLVGETIVILSNSGGSTLGVLTVSAFFVFQTVSVAVSVYYFGKMIIPHKHLLEKMRCNCTLNAVSPLAIPYIEPYSRQQ